MADITYDLTKVSVSSGSFTTDEADGAKINGNITLAKKPEGNMSVLQDKNGILFAGENNDYDFTALAGGKFAFTDSETQAAIKSFDGAGVTSKIELTIDKSNGNKKLASVTTGAGKDSIKVTDAGDGVVFDLGAGNDIFQFTKGEATVTLGEGADLVSVDASAGDKLKITDYNYAEGDVIQIAATAKLDMDYTKSTATVTNGSTTVEAATTLNNGVYEFNIKDTAGTAPTHYVRTDVSSVEYVAKDAINFESTKDTTTLNLTLADKTNNVVNVGATEGTVNIVAGKDAANTVTVGAGVDLGLGITKKSGETILTTNGNTNAVLDSKDTLYLRDNGKISDVKFGTDGLLTYGAASVKGGYDHNNGGRFNYNTNGTNGVLMYAKAHTEAVTYTQGVSYYANAATVDASEYGDVVLNLNGVCGDAFADTIKEIRGVTSGLVAGRDNEKTTIHIATDAGKKTEVYGGAGSKGGDDINLTQADSDSTNVIWYSNGDGMDTVTGFAGNGNNSIYFHDSAAAASVLNDITKVVGDDLTMTMSAKKDVLTLKGVKAVANETNVVDFKDKAGNTFKLAVGDGTNVTYASNINVYKGATTLKVGGSDDRVIYTGAKNDQFGYYDGITTIDAKEATGTVYLSGTNTNGMEIKGGEGVNHMWGGGDKVQTLTGGAGVNVFWFGNGDGRDTANNAKAEDGVNLYNVEKIDDVAVKASTNYFTVTVGSNSLKVNLGTANAEDALKTFTFADKAGVQYTYDTKTNKFQKK